MPETETEVSETFSTLHAKAAIEAIADEVRALKEQNARQDEAIKRLAAHLGESEAVEAILA